MDANHIYDYLARISNLIRMEARRSGTVKGLQPVQLEALHYLASCNRYSNTPLAVAEYLGLTKGTVSQTLAVLEGNGMIVKESDPRDRRVVHLRLTNAGHGLLADAVPPKVLRTAVDSLPAEHRAGLETALNEVLGAMQTANQLKTFGACKSCRHHLVLDDTTSRCELTGEFLSREDADKICREHQAPATV